MKKLLFISLLTFFISQKGFSQFTIPPNIVGKALAKKQIEIKAEQHFYRFIEEKKWGNPTIQLTQWEKGHYEIWFYTSYRVVGKVHYYEKATKYMFEEIDWITRRGYNIRL